jgi:membrane-bound lytic murein transglycosylase A
VARFIYALALMMTILVTTAGARTVFEPVNFSALEGWQDDDHAAALAAFQRSCAEILDHGRAFSRPIKYGGSRAAWLTVCRKASIAKHARKFFETELTPLRVHDADRPDGLFTGYFEPEVLGSRAPSKKFPVPIYAKPKDLVALDAAQQKATGLRYGRIAAGKAKPYFTRRQIEDGALNGRNLELVWLKDGADAFFIQVQGSGRVRLADGSAMRLAYAAKTGLPYTAIGGVLVERGAIAKEDMSMQAIRAWMRDNPKDARALMWMNESFVFFREIEVPEPGLGAPGAQTVQLTPMRSLAVDRGLWAFGTPVWLDSYIPGDDGGIGPAFRRLLIAQDTGTAIRGAVRGDVYWGWGDKAAYIAGHMKSTGTMVVLLPNPVARKLLAGQ